MDMSYSKMKITLVELISRVHYARWLVWDNAEQLLGTFQDNGHFIMKI